MERKEEKDQHFGSLYSAILSTERKEKDRRFEFLYAATPSMKRKEKDRSFYKPQSPFASKRRDPVDASSPYTSRFVDPLSLWKPRFPMQVGGDDGSFESQCCAISVLCDPVCSTKEMMEILGLYT